jgi:putative hydrolases of HD superfamily
MSTADLQSLLRLFTAANDLKMLPRTGWLFAGVAAPESLADHTCAVSLYTLLLCGQINVDPAAQGLAQPLDVERSVAMALVHDLAESVLTDLPKRSTAVIGESVKHAAEKEVLAALFADISHGSHYMELWEEYQAASTPEAKLVKDVDKLEMVIQALRYSQRGHQNLQEFWKEQTWHYPIGRELYETLLQQR